MNIRDIIKKATETDAEIYSAIATVESVDASSRTCVVQPINGSPKIYGVRYTVTDGDSVGLIANPKNGSFVVVSWLDDNNAFVSLMTEFDGITIKSDSGDLKQILLDLVAAIKVLTVPTPAGASATPINAAQFTTIENQLNQFFE